MRIAGAALALLALLQVNFSQPLPTTGTEDGATGSAVPARASYTGANSGGNLVGIVACDASAQAAIASATTTQLVALSAGKTIYVCGFVVEIQGIATTAGTAKLVYGTGSSCATSPVNLTPDFIGSTTAGTPTVIALGNGLGVVTKTAASNALCVTTTTTTVQKVLVSYTQF
jgi:hypothetical protein